MSLLEAKSPLLTQNPFLSLDKGIKILSRIEEKGRLLEVFYDKHSKSYGFYAEYAHYGIDACNDGFDSPSAARCAGYYWLEDGFMYHPNCPESLPVID